MENTNQMVLDYLQVSEPTHKSAFLQHINELIQIPWKQEESYADMFKNLEAYGEQHPETKEAIKDWIEFNKEHMSEEDLTTKPVTADDMYAVFNLRPNY